MGNVSLVDSAGCYMMRVKKELVRMEKLTKTLFSQSKELEAVAEEEMKEEYEEVKEERGR